MRRSHPTVPALFVVALAATPLAASGQDFMLRQPKGAFTLKAGANLALAGSDLFDFTRERLTLDRNDFHTVFVGGALELTGNEGFDVVIDAAIMQSETGSEYRHFVEDNDLPIQQRTRFRQIPISVSVKVPLQSTGRSVGRFAWVPARVVPYVGAGGGVMHYTFEQWGDFVDENDDTYPIFTDTFSSSGWAPLASGYGGLDINVGPRTRLSVEARYTWSRAEMDDDFIEFEPIDLSGIQTAVGVAYRF